MADPRDLARMTELELALVELGRSLAWPAPASTLEDAATRARRRIVTEGVRPTTSAWRLPAPRGRSLRSSLVLAAIAILVVAAIAAAIGLGLPGIRITFTSSPAPSTAPAPTASPFGAPSSRPSPSPSRGPSPTPSAGPLGWQLGLGSPIAVRDLAASVDFPFRLPSSVGAPASGWLLDGRATAVWPAGASLPPLEAPDLGLVLTEFRGDVDSGYFEKILSPGTTIQPATVDGVVGYWISGRPHELVFVNPSGEPVFDSRRIVGDTLIWAKDGITYRLETALDRDGAVALADALR